MGCVYRLAGRAATGLGETVKAAFRGSRGRASDHDEMLLLRPRYGVERDRAVEREELAAVGDRQGEQVDVRQLLRTMHARRIDRHIVEDTHVVRPEFVAPVRRRLTQAICDRHNGRGVGIPGLRHDPDASVLGDRTGRPSSAAVVVEPPQGGRMQRMVRIEEGNEDVHVQERAHQYASPSRSLSTSSLVTRLPRFGKGRMPWCDCAPRAFAVLRGGAVRAARASSEITSPVVLFSRRARSFAAARTSSAMSSVVRMHLMLTHPHQMSNYHLTLARSSSRRDSGAVRVPAGGSSCNLVSWNPVPPFLRLPGPAWGAPRSDMH